MPRFVKEILRPGRYRKAGQVIDVTPDDVRAYFKSVTDLSKNGLGVPLVWEHPPATADGLGTPLPLSDYEKRAYQTKYTAGWARPDDARSKVTKDGRAYLAFDVPDKADADKLKSQGVKFVSPELRPAWEDGKGRRYERCISHVAITHKPIQVDQQAEFQELALSDVSEGLTLSVGDWLDPDEVQLADDTPSGLDQSGNTDTSASENPDMPKQAPDQSKFKAIIAHLEQLGVMLPADTDEASFFDRILASLMTATAAQQKAEQEKKADDGDDDGEIEEKSPNSISQFSDPVGLPECAIKVAQLADQGKITPGFRDHLLTKVRSVAVQLSDADESSLVNVVPVDELLDVLAKGPQLVQLGHTEGLQLSEHAPSAGFTRKPGPLRKGDPEAEAESDEVYAKYKAACGW